MHSVNYFGIGPCVSSRNQSDPCHHTCCLELRDEAGNLCSRNYVMELTSPEIHSFLEIVPLDKVKSAYEQTHFPANVDLELARRCLGGNDPAKVDALEIDNGCLETDPPRHNFCAHLEGGSSVRGDSTHPEIYNLLQVIPSGSVKTNWPLSHFFPIDRPDVDSLLGAVQDKLEYSFPAFAEEAESTSRECSPQKADAKITLKTWQKVRNFILNFVTLGFFRRYQQMRLYRALDAGRVKTAKSALRFGADLVKYLEKLHVDKVRRLAEIRPNSLAFLVSQISFRNIWRKGQHPIEGNKVVSSMAVSPQAGWVVVEARDDTSSREMDPAVLKCLPVETFPQTAYYAYRFHGMTASSKSYFRSFNVDLQPCIKFDSNNPHMGPIRATIHAH